MADRTGKVRFGGKVLMVGCGVVGRCTVPLLLRHLDVPASKITVIDFVDNSEAIKDSIAKGVKFRVDRITRQNIKKKLAEYVGRGDLVVDLAWNIDCAEILQYCHDNGIMYVNTSVEVWDPYAGAENKPPTERTLYVRHMAIRKMVAGWKQKGATAVLEHGANPGLVSHFTKIALEDIARKIIAEKPKDERVPNLIKLLAERNYPEIARAEGVKVIHVSERDTQITDEPKKENEFVNTWSIEGFNEEGIAPAEMGWGTHEKTLPKNAWEHEDGPRNQICLAQPGIKTWVRSWVPCGEITGMVVRHGEAFTISDYLTVWSGKGAKRKPAYRPTVHYAYCPCDAAINSLHELEMRQFSLQEKQRIMGDEITQGRDELGVLLMGHDFNAWWVGSLLDIHEARRLVPHQNATTLQVACSVIGAICWMIENPAEGVLVPDNLPHEQVMSVARPYLGPMLSTPVDWTPLKNKRDLYAKFERIGKKPGEAWEFENFRL